MQSFTTRRSRSLPPPPISPMGKWNFRSIALTYILLFISCKTGNIYGVLLWNLQASIAKHREIRFHHAKFQSCQVYPSQIIIGQNLQIVIHICCWQFIANKLYFSNICHTWCLFECETNWGFLKSCDVIDLDCKQRCNELIYLCNIFIQPKKEFHMIQKTQKSVSGKDIDIRQIPSTSLKTEILSAPNFILTHWNNCLLAKCKNLYKFADKEIKKSGYWRFRCNGPSTSCSGPSPTLKQGKSALFAIDKSSKTWKTIFYHVIWTKS